MKKIAILFMLTCALFLFSSLYIFDFKNKSSSINKPIITKETVSFQQEDSYKETRLLFIPYWSFGQEKIHSDGYTELVYFGVAVNKEGIRKDDIGYQKIRTFIQITNNNSKRLLAIRMTDSDINSQVLENSELQKNIIEGSLQIASDYSFDGIVLDFELSALSFNSVMQKINSFYKEFYENTKQKNLLFYTTIYGDIFYRLRPYDIATLGSYADKILIMTYDFHKSNGEPGPNFPLGGKEVYGYDYKSLIHDFEQKVTKEKILYVFGLFGYDWILDEDNKPVGGATSLSFNEAKNKFRLPCVFKNCIVTRDEKSAETRVEYTDSQSRNHIVWFEDIDSMSKKRDYLKQHKIHSFGFWAYSYF